MIAKPAIRKYLKFKPRDLHRVKKQKLKRLRQLVYDIVPQGFFKLEPYKHQLACLLLAWHYEQVLMFLDMGLGKTKLMLDAFRMRRHHKQARRMLVLVPYTSNVWEWEEQAGIHAPGLRVTCIGGAMDEDRFEAACRGQVVVTTYQGLLHLLHKKKKGKDDKGWAIHDYRAKKLAATFDMVVYDEITHLRKPSSAHYRACLRFTNAARFRYGLTGTPFGHDPSHLWPQFYLVDKGETLGQSLGLFRAGFFSEKPRYWGGGMDYKFMDSMASKLHRRMRNRSIHYTKNECLDMPKLVTVHRKVTWSAEQWTYYEKIVEDIKAARKALKIPENTYLQSRYLAAGYLPFKDTEEGTHLITFKENHKLQALMDLLAEVPPDCKAIVFGVYNHTIELLSNALITAKVKHAVIYGKQTGGKKKSEAKRFKDVQSCRVLVASEAAAFGLNLQVANYVFVYENPSDPITLKQMVSRAHRGGQKKDRVFVYHLMIKNSVDERIRAAQLKGYDLYRRIVKGA